MSFTENDLVVFRMTSRVLCSAQYHRQHCTLHAFEQFRALYKNNHDDKYPTGPGFEPGTSRLHAPVDMNVVSGPACLLHELCEWHIDNSPHIRLTYNIYIGIRYTQ